jgi:hypothetical protein
MSEILSVGGISPPLSNHRSVPGYPGSRPGPDPDAQGGVAVPRFSDALRRVVDQSSLRQARLRAIQADIQQHTYETPERITGTVDRLLDVIA